MHLEAIATLFLGGLAFWWGTKLGSMLLRQGATANDMFKGKNSVSLLFLGLYMGLLLLALHVPQWQMLPLEWRISGMRVTWTLIRVILLGFCGVTTAVSWQTARLQIVAIALLGILGISGFTATEALFLAPIHTELRDNLRPNGIFEQTSTSSCAPSALATILRRWGLQETESSIARLAGTSYLGTSMPQLVSALEAIEMEAIELSPTWEQMRQINRPGVLATWLYSEGRRDPHAVALVGLNETTVTIADPAFGKYFQVPKAQFERIWRREYLPVFRPQDVTLTASEVSDYLRRLGYLSDQNGIDRAVLEPAIRQFQKAMRIDETGVANPQTVLMLTGQFLTGVPTLKQPIQELLIEP
jgi:predicted double-glycine peptidase